MTRLTENELKLLNYIIEASSFNGDSVELDKTFDEQRFEDPDMYQTFVELKYYKKHLGFDNASSRAILGSLVKKSFIQIYQDEDYPKTYWIQIYEENFNNIKEALKEMETNNG